MQTSGSELSPYGRGGRGAGNIDDIVRRELEGMLSLLSSLGGPSLLGGARRSMIGGAGGILGSSIPVDVTETENAYQLIAEVPGLTERDIDVTVSNETLTIRGHKQHQSQLGGGQQPGQGSGGSAQRGQHYHVVERQYGEFVRSFQLPSNADPEKISAEFNHGLLTITVPKTAESQKQQRRIEVKQGQPQQNR